MSTAIPRPDIVAGAAPADAADDRLRRVVQAVLAVYLLPALIVVLVVGVTLMALQGLCSLAFWVLRRLNALVAGPEARRPGLPASPSMTGRVSGLGPRSVSRGVHDGFAHRN